MNRCQSAAAPVDKNGCAESITLHRDPQTDEWVFDLSPGLDLLEVARVLSVVQQQALHLLQQQLHTTPAGGPPGMPPLATATPTPNQFAQL
jgi:hypothetical protein